MPNQMRLCNLDGLVINSNNLTVHPPSLMTNLTSPRAAVGRILLDLLRPPLVEDLVAVAEEDMEAALAAEDTVVVRVVEDSAEDMAEERVVAEEDLDATHDREAALWAHLALLALPLAPLGSLALVGTARRMSTTNGK